MKLRTMYDVSVYLLRLECMDHPVCRKQYQASLSPSNHYVTIGTVYIKQEPDTGACAVENPSMHHHGDGLTDDGSMGERREEDISTVHVKQEASNTDPMCSDFLNDDDCLVDGSTERPRAGNMIAVQGGAHVHVRHLITGEITADEDCSAERYRTNDMTAVQVELHSSNRRTDSKYNNDHNLTTDDDGSVEGYWVTVKATVQEEQHARDLNPSTYSNYSDAYHNDNEDDNDNLSSEIITDEDSSEEAQRVHNIAVVHEEQDSPRPPSEVPRVKSGSRYDCNICGKSYSLKNNLRKHAATHKKSKAIVCEKCGSRFTRKDNLQAHIRYFHFGQQRDPKKEDDKLSFSCKICGKSARTKKCLKSHMLIHSDEKNYQCEICKKSFTYQSSLSRHSLMHSSCPRPYKCDVCGSDFKQSAHLKSHKLLHKGDKSFKCDFCAKCFMRKTHLRLHMKQHTVTN